MIIQCDHCSAKFRLDDSKLANGPVKVRCAKCKEIFVVQQEEPASESTLSPQPESAPSAGDGMGAAIPAEPPGNTEDLFSQGATDFSFDVESPAVKNEAASGSTDSLSEFDWQGTSTDSNTPETSLGFDLSSFDASLASAAADATAEDADNSDFDFGDMNFNAEGEQPAERSAEADLSPADDYSAGFGDISFSDQPADSTPVIDSQAAYSSEAVSAPADISTQPADHSNSDDFMLSFDSDPAQQSSSSASVAVEPEHVNFGEFSFGETGGPASKDNGAPTVGLMEQDSGEFDAVGFSEQYPEEDLPPASLTSRKKSGSLFPLLVIAAAMLLIIALAGSGVYFFGGPKAFSKIGLGFLVDWYGDKAVEDGSIALQGVTATYIINSTAGELFVVRGEAVNNFKKPRASIQIKVSLLGAGGASLVTKSAFCGNSLSNEQLASLPLAKVEEIMNNQFGDSLANLGLKPGGMIPFVVVVSPVAKDATDYTVQVGGSTVATQ